ncbi:MAG: methyltransferase domain-containing protein [Anaerolineae bacterium]|nr:methyltransferase domain-containing protein [Anaerolineae bacterium]
MQTIRGAWWRLVRFGFRLLYNELAFTYDTVSYVVSLGEWRAWQRAALNFLPPPSAPVLELAHGTGNLQLDLHAAGVRSVAIDLSPYMSRIAVRKLRRANVPPRLVRARAEQLPFRDESFSAALSTFPTSFILALETLREVYRVLQPSGRLIVVPNAVFTGKSVAQRSIELAYRLTGQRSGAPFNLSERFAAAGFRLSLAQVPAKRSVVQVVIAEKPSN